jgi:hypothetical protein
MNRAEMAAMQEHLEKQNDKISNYKTEMMSRSAECL